MKKLMIVMMIVTMVLAMVGCTESNNEQKMTVSKVENDVVFVVDNNGEEWSFFGDGFTDGETIVVVMEDNAIVDVRA